MGAAITSDNYGIRDNNKLPDHMHGLDNRVTEVSRVFLSVFHLEVENQVVTLETTGDLQLTASSTNTLLAKMQYTLRYKTY